VRYLVSGGAGYIGSVVTAALVAGGHDVTVLDDLSTGHRDAVDPGAQFVQTSITDAAEVLAAAKYDGVLHFAARSLVAESVDKPDAYWHNNVAGTLALLDAVRSNDVPRIVFSSSAATYGDTTENPITEDLPPRPTNPYGASKLAVDMALAGYTAAFGFGAVSLRYFNVAGAQGPYGERHTVESHLIPIILQVAGGSRESLSVYGTDYPTPDGTCVRDYVHVVDLADAHVRALDACRPGTHEVINLGSGRGYSVREVIETARAVTGRELPVVEAARRPGDPAVLVASNAKAHSRLGWRPTRDLHRMVEDAWTFAQARSARDSAAQETAS
jgi:UDP-glucose 4-epimerase